MKYIGYEHPATAACGITGYHRVVLWDKLEGQNTNCHWCDTPLYWEKGFPTHKDGLVVDHLNGIKNDDRPENLVPSCGRCNLTREGVRKPGRMREIDGECQFEGCKNEARARGRKSKHLFVCIAHYNQEYIGNEMTPLRPYLMLPRTDSGREMLNL